MSDYYNGQIHGWNGGECPVHPETVVKTWRRLGGCEPNLPAKKMEWGHLKHCGDIIAFQVVKPYVEPKVIWVVRDIRGKGSEILYAGDQEDAAWRVAGIDPENRRVEKYVEARDE